MYKLATGERWQLVCGHHKTETQLDHHSAMWLLNINLADMDEYKVYPHTSPFPVNDLVCGCPLSHNYLMIS